MVCLYNDVIELNAYQNISLNATVDISLVICSWNIGGLNYLIYTNTQ